MRNLIAAFILLLSFHLSAQSVWTSISDESIITSRNNSEREIVPEKYTSYSLDLDLMKFKLSDAPSEKAANRWRNAVEVELPFPDGHTETFLFVESPVMSEVLAAKFPNIKSYRGVSKTNAYHKARIDFGENMGFHGAIKTLEGPIYVDPYFANPNENYISYYTKDHLVDMSQYGDKICGIQDYEDQVNGISLSNDPSAQVNTRDDNDPVVKRTYRLAVATTGEFGQIYGTVENVMERIVTGVNRLNQILENDAAIFFRLVDNNDEIVFLDPTTDPYNPGTTGHAGRMILGQNTNVLNSTIGFNNYDIGHVFTRTCTDGIAGVAALGSACGSNKGNGVSCVGASNISAFMVNTTAHELGHQFNCGHTWGTCPNAQDQFAAGSAFEPGSGITILSYAGACGNNNLSGTNTDHYHVGSLEQIYNFVNQAIPNCGILEDTDNTCPQVTVPVGDGAFIPIQTPFELIGEAEDAEGDAMTYAWEQYDAGGGFTLGEQSLTGPQFTVQMPGPTKIRTIPNRQGLLTMNWNNPQEIIPFGNRAYNFRFVVRDNHPEAGIANWEQIAFNSTEEAGPFRVTTPSTVLNAEVGEEILVEWDVANTDQAPVNCQTVDIFLSTNGGIDFPILAKTNTANDGSETIIVPNVISNLVRVKVKASENIFFNISFPNFRIVEPAEPGFYFDLGLLTADVCLPDQIEIPILGTAFQDFSNDINFEVIDGLPAGAVASFSESTIAPSESTTLNLDLNGVNTTGRFNIVIRGTSTDADTLEQNFVLNVVGTDFSDLALLSPLQGAIQMGIDTFRWTDTQNASSYGFELATNPNFAPENIVETASNLLNNSYVPQQVLEKSTLYYWRVTASNKCTDSGYSEVFSYATEALSCNVIEAADLPKNITQSGLPTVESRTFIPSTGQVSDINIKSIKGLHENMGDLTISLLNPEGIEVILYDRTCFSTQDFNAGFDDESPLSIECPINNTRTFRPVESLSIFNGKDINGDWTLRIKDNEPGNGGEFQSMELQICSNKALDSPILVNNEVLAVRRGFARYIENIGLLTTDENNGDDELIYTLVSAPEYGSLSNNGEIVEVGNTWTQKEINDLNLKYTNNGDPSTDDQFRFTVVDGEGGWIGITSFAITISDDDAIPTAVEDVELEKIDFKIYPNPTGQFVFIQNKNETTYTDWQGKLIDITGRVVKEFSVSNKDILKLDVTDSAQGVYIVRLQNGTQTVSYSLSVVR